MREATFYINTQPVPAKSHRSNNSRIYNPLSLIKKAHEAILRRQMNNFLETTEHMFCGPIHVSVKFFMPLPKRKKTRSAMGLYHTNKPDIDNLLKFILDVMSEIVYADDAYICTIEAVKLYSEDTRTEIKIRELVQIKKTWDVYEKKHHSTINNKEK